MYIYSAWSILWEKGAKAIKQGNLIWLWGWFRISLGKRHLVRSAEWEWVNSVKDWAGVCVWDCRVMEEIVTDAKQKTGRERQVEGNLLCLMSWHFLWYLVGLPVCGFFFFLLDKSQIGMSRIFLGRWVLAFVEVVLY